MSDAERAAAARARVSADRKRGVETASWIVDLAEGRGVPEGEDVRLIGPAPAYWVARQAEGLQVMAYNDKEHVEHLARFYGGEVVPLFLLEGRVPVDKEVAWKVLAVAANHALTDEERQACMRLAEQLGPA